MEKLLFLSVLSLGILSKAPTFALFPGVPSDNGRPRQEQARYLGDGNGNAVQNSNDAEMGQLSGFFNALVGELQNAPQLANGPQAKKQGNGDPFLPAAVADSQPVAAVTASPAVTDAPPDDTVTPDMRQKPVTNNNVNRFSGPSNNGPSFENFNPPSPNFNGPNFNGPNFNGPSNFDGPQQGPGSMFMPPPGMQSPFGPGPFSQQGPYGGGPGPYDGGNGYGNGYDQGPPVTRKPVGNPNSYGADNSQLQEMGIGQLGQFFSSMVGELQNSGFNNNAQSAVAAKKPVTTKTTTTTTTTTTTPKTTKSTTESDE